MKEPTGTDLVPRAARLPPIAPGVAVATRGSHEPAGAAPPSFERFFDDHHDELLRALWLVTRDRHEAEEITQEAFVRVWERWGRVGGLGDPTGYLYRTAMNVFRSRLRRTRLAVRHAIGPRPPDDLLAAVEARDAVVRALAPLTPRQRAAIVLVDVLGLSSDEAGRALHVRPSTVRVLAARGRHTLERALGGDHD